MAQDLTAKNYRRLADECLQDAKDAKFPDVQVAYEKLAADWLKLAEKSERSHGR